MRLTTRIGIGIAAGIIALATAGEARAQAFAVPGYGRSYGYNSPFYGGAPGYGYGTGYGYSPYGNYGRYYPAYGAQLYAPPASYNNVNGVAGLIGGAVAPRRTRVVAPYPGSPFGW